MKGGLQFLILVSLFIAMVGTGYVMVATLFFNDPSYAGFYSTWQFPMLVAIFIDATCHRHLQRLHG